MTDIINAIGDLGQALGTVSKFFGALKDISSGSGQLVGSVAGLLGGK